MEDKLKACPFCGSTNIRAPIDEDGWMCRTCGTESYVDWNRRPIEDALRLRIAELEESDKHWAGNVKVCMQLIERYESDIAELEEAVGLITTLKPTMVMDTEHPLDMAKEVVEYVNARIAEFDVAELLDEINSLKKYKAESESVISKAKDLLGDEMGEWLPVDPVYLPERLQQLRQVLYILEGLEKGA